MNDIEKVIDKVANNLVWYRDTNEEKGVVCIPLYHIESAIENLCDIVLPLRELQEQTPKWHLLADGDFPKAEESVLLVTKHIGYQGKVYYNTFRGIYEDGTIHSEDSIWSWNSDYIDALEYCEETDDYIIGEGWYEESLYNPENMSYEIDERDKIIAWMELPEFKEM